MIPNRQLVVGLVFSALPFCLIGSRFCVRKFECDYGGCAGEICVIGIFRFWFAVYGLRWGLVL